MIECYEVCKGSTFCRRDSQLDKTSDTGDGAAHMIPAKKNISRSTSSSDGSKNNQRKHSALERLFSFDAWSNIAHSKSVFDGFLWAFGGRFRLVEVSCTPTKTMLPNKNSMIEWEGDDWGV